MPNVKLQTLILLGVTPLLGVISTVIAVSHYFDIRQLIMRGFDQKLFAVSTVTASFIDPQVHASIYRPIDIRNLVYHRRDRLLYGLDASGYLYEINLITGEALPVQFINVYNLTDLTYHSNDGLIYGVNGAGQELITIDPSDGEVRSLPLSTAVSGITYDEDADILYGSHRSLSTIDPTTGTVTPISTLPTFVRSLSIDNGILYGTTIQDQPLIAIDPATAAPLPLPFIDELMAKTQQPLLGIDITPERQLLIAGSQQLFHVNLATQVIETDFASGYRSEATPAYQGYVQPMQRINNRLNLTYVYTQIVSGDRTITYVLDATEGDEHTPIGLVENQTEEEFIGVEKVASTGRVYLSGIKPWEEWGLLKVAYAPILNETGQVVAMAGADVNISIITQKTRAALLRVMSVGIVSLLVGIVASVYISRRLTQPIESVKTMALKIAAGHYGQQMVISQPQEIADLVQSFNHMSVALQRNLANLQHTNDSLETVRRQQELIEMLGQMQPEPLEHHHPPVIQLYTPDPSHHAAGWVSEGDRILVWLPHPQTNLIDPKLDSLSTLLPRNDTEIVAYTQRQQSRLLATRQYKELERITSRLLQHYVDWSSIRPGLEPLFPLDITSFIVYDATTHSLRAIARHSSPFILLSLHQPYQVGNFLDSPELQLEPHQVIVVISGNTQIKQDSAADLLDIPELNTLLQMLQDVLTQAAEHRTRLTTPIFVAAVP
ncbi:MAG: HAMP domain-containing protein [Leptolyngbya sp. DLM2.Bin15]|nr:MAG: HAMP domain-containing protein [Leptolyngbya sp. DLM2.Bin15]